MDFKKLIESISSASKLCGKKREALDKKEASLKKSLDTLADMCRPHCVEAAEKYNIGQPWQIITSMLALSFDLENRKICLSLRLRTLSGHEPDEDFDEKDLKKIESKIGPVLDQLLSRKKIPLTFGGAFVPSWYYPK